MSMLSQIKQLLAPLGVPLETGVFSDKAPDEYIVVIPIDDNFDVFADNKPLIDINEARISIYSKGNYIQLKDAIVRAFVEADFTITARQYLGYEPDTEYHHYNVDVAQYYETEDF